MTCLMHRFNERNVPIASRGHHTKWDSVRSDVHNPEPWRGIESYEDCLHMYVYINCRIWFCLCLQGTAVFTSESEKKAK